MTRTTGVHAGDRLEEARRLAEDGELDAAAEIFAELVADPDGPDRAQAAVGLAVVLEARGDVEGARRAARTALATGHPEYAPQAAHHLARGYEREAQRLLEEGEPGQAADALLEALEIPGIAGTARLRVLLGMAHLDLACEQLAAAVEEEPDAGTGALAIELLARTLPLRGRDADAAQVWRYGLDHPDPELAAEVRLRMGRDLGRSVP